jgi:hypothetical protein
MWEIVEGMPLEIAMQVEISNHLRPSRSGKTTIGRVNLGTKKPQDDKTSSKVKTLI